MKVLFVDDEAVICESIQADFKRMEHPREYEVFTANSVAEAEAVYDRKKPKLLITDITMPGGSGLLLVEKVRKADPDCGILVLSAYDDYEYVRNAFRMGADDYLLKPIAFAELKKQVEKLAEKYENSNREESFQTKNEEKIYKIEQIVEYIQEHAAEKLSAAELAKKMAVSYGTFGKLFKDYTNMSFSGYVLWYRMELAKEYLKNPSVKIKQAASKVGYKDNPQHFSRDFTRQVGCSPKEYRMRHVFSQNPETKR